MRQFPRINNDNAAAFSYSSAAAGPMCVTHLATRVSDQQLKGENSTYRLSVLTRGAPRSHEIWPDSVHVGVKLPPKI